MKCWSGKQDHFEIGVKQSTSQSNWGSDAMEVWPSWVGKDQRDMDQLFSIPFCFLFVLPLCHFCFLCVNLVLHHTVHYVSNYALHLYYYLTWPALCSLFASGSKAIYEIRYFESWGTLLWWRHHISASALFPVLSELLASEISSLLTDWYLSIQYVTI